MTPAEKSRSASALLGASIGFAIGVLVVWQLYFQGADLTGQGFAFAAISGAVFAILGAILGAIIG